MASLAKVTSKTKVTHEILPKRMVNLKPLFCNNAGGWPIDNVHQLRLAEARQWGHTDRETRRRIPSSPSWSCIVWTFSSPCARGSIAGKLGKLWWVIVLFLLSLGALWPNSYMFKHGDQHWRGLESDTCQSSVRVRWGGWRLVCVFM